MGIRIDTLLHWLCLRKSRSLAARGCREGMILLNGRPVRPSQEVNEGDWISIADRRREDWISVEITDLPARQIGRAAARDYYRSLAEEGPASGSRRATAARRDRSQAPDSGAEGHE